MLWRVLPFAFAAAMGVALPAAGQGRITGPAEAPPAGFTGGQYIDSRGCAFMRAGHGGQVQWVARIGADRRPVCGMTPTRSAMASARAALDRPEAGTVPTAAASAPAASAAPTAPRRAGQPVGTVASTTTPPRIAPAPGRPARTSIPAAQYAAPRAVPAAPGASDPAASAPVAAWGCPDQAPARQVFDRVDGGKVVFCTGQGMRATGNRPDDKRLRRAIRAAGGIVPGEAPAIAASSPPPAPARRVAGAPSARRSCPEQAPLRQVFDRWGGGTVVFCTPAGLNVTGARPGDAQLRRAIRAAGGVLPGDADPARARAAAESPTGLAIPEGYKPAWTDGRLNPHRGPRTASGEAAMARAREVPQELAAAPAARPVAWVQAGVYGVPANAGRSAARLDALGLPVRMSQARLGGKPVQVVVAGPFADAGQVSAALAAVRRAGFTDAFIRR